MKSFFKRNLNTLYLLIVAIMAYYGHYRYAYKYNHEPNYLLFYSFLIMAILSLAQNEYIHYTDKLNKQEKEIFDNKLLKFIKTTIASICIIIIILNLISVITYIWSAIFATVILFILIFDYLDSKR